MKVDELARRPTEYLNDSGLTTLVPGVAWMFAGISQLIWPLLVRGHPNTALIVQFAGVGLSGLALFAGWKLKQRVVFPRSGYAVPRQPPTYRAIFLLGFAGVFLIWFLARGGHKFDPGHFAAAPYFAFLVALIVASSTWKKKTRLGYWFAGYLVCLGAALLYFQPDAFAGMSWLQIGIGGPMAVYGAIRLRRFMEENPVAAGE